MRLALASVAVPPAKKATAKCVVIASVYADHFSGRLMANGEIFRPHALTAAHKTIPFGTRIKIRSIRTGKCVKVTITDRGPFIKGRALDLSQAAARAIGLRGVERVEMWIACR